VARGGVKQSTAGAPVEGPWALPEGWRWERIETIAPVNPRRVRDGLADETEVAFVPMASVQAGTGGIDVTTRRAVGSVRKGFTRFGPGDVLFAKITPCMENGKIAIVPDVPAGTGFGSTEFHVLSPRDVTSKYLYYWVSQRGFRETAEFNMTGTAGQKRVPTDFMRDALIPVPPPEVQAAIVARIDELFAEVEDGETALARARDDLATWRKALLKAAVTGELTADWRAANPPSQTGADLLALILAKRRASWEAKPTNKGRGYKEPRPLAINDGRELPEGWTWASVDQIGEVVTGNTPPASDLAAYDGDVPFFTA
jgi:type I restriction enzyme S subunit